MTRMDILRRLRRPSPAISDADLFIGFQCIKSQQLAARCRIAAQQAGVKVVRVVDEDSLKAFENSVNRLRKMHKGPALTRAVKR